MEKKYLKISIIIILILIIIIGIILVCNIRNKTTINKTKNTEIIEDEDSSIISTSSYEETPVKNETMFYTISNCVKKYLEIASDNSNSLYNNDRNTALYNILSKSFIKKNNIKLDNAYEYIVESMPVEKYFIAISMNVINDGIIDMYSIKGIISSQQEFKNFQEVYFIVTIDKSNMTFSINPIKDNQYSQISEIKMNIDISSIDKNKYNVYEYDRVDKSELLNRYIEFYKLFALNNPEEIYKYLNREYKNLRFSSLEKFENYIDNNKIEIANVTLDKYQQTQEDGYIQYVCIDTKGNYYLFKEFSTMQFDLLLDTYTIDLPEFIEKYNSTNVQTKVGMNIEKVIEAINRKDYKYVYNKLDETFKKNKYDTLEKFERTIKDSFYDYNDVEYTKFSKSGDNYVYELKLKNLEDSNIQGKVLTIIMKLQEGTDFVMSFNIE